MYRHLQCVSSVIKNHKNHLSMAEKYRGFHIRTSCPLHQVYITPSPPPGPQRALTYVPPVYTHKGPPHLQYPVENVVKLLEEISPSGPPGEPRGEGAEGSGSTPLFLHLCHIPLGTALY